MQNSPISFNEPTTIIYHGASCRDGFCAAWLANMAFKNAEFVPAVYGDPPPNVVGRQVLIVDFSYPADQLFELHNNCDGPLVVLDHHKTAQKTLEEFVAKCQSLGIEPYVEYSEDRSGAVMMFDFIERFSGKFANSCQIVTTYVQDRDLWKWELPDSKAVNAAIRSYPLDFAAWDMIAHNSIEALAQQGKAILRRESQIVESHVRNAKPIRFDGHVVPCVNCSVDMSSEVCGSLAIDNPFAMSYFDTAEGFRVFSLRSAPTGLDVGEIAKRYGGGGHKHAAGFRIAIKPNPTHGAGRSVIQDKSRLRRSLDRLRSGTCSTQHAVDAAELLEEMMELLHSIVDIGISETEAAAHSMRKLVGYKTGPYPELEPETSERLPNG